MMMRMLEAGGIPVWTDGIRFADDQNPHGYYELERVKDLDKTTDKRWLRAGRGRAVKVISSLLEHLPLTNNYAVLFMDRDLTEIVTSQNKMLADRGVANEASNDVAMAAAFETHLRYVNGWLARTAAFSTLHVPYRDTLAQPTATAQRIRAFLRRDLAIESMVASVDASLYRNKAT
ncbi:MAG TPA: hypothetical protein VJ691_15475 [Vicinamibacterales bacterium]|nr:hypothetical protein [Vicinamibacterales bacterium]